MCWIACFVHLEALAPQKINVKVIANPQRRLAKLADCSEFADVVRFLQVPCLDGCLHSNPALEFSESVDNACVLVTAFRCVCVCDIHVRPFEVIGGCLAKEGRV